MRVAVLIVGFNNAQDITRCLNSLSASTHVDFKVTVCENGDENSYLSLAKQIPATLPGGQAVEIFWSGSNIGFAAGVNSCIRRNPDADAWWLLNPDTEPDPNAMSAKLARLSAGDCDAVGCTIELSSGLVQSYGGKWQGWSARAVSLGNGARVGSGPDAADVERQQNYLNGAAMMVGPRFLRLAGPMREDYFLYCEEVEWCLRAIEQGARLGFCSGAVVRHSQGSTTGYTSDPRGRSRLAVFLTERNRLLLTRDRFPARWTVAALFSLAGIGLRYARRGAMRQTAYALAGWWAGVRGRRGRPAWCAA